MKKIEITFNIRTQAKETTYASIEHEFHDKIIRSIRRDAAAFKKEYEQDTGEECEPGNHCYAQGIDLSDVLFTEQYESILEECREEARNLYPTSPIHILIETDLEQFLQNLDALEAQE